MNDLSLSSNDLGLPKNGMSWKIGAFVPFVKEMKRYGNKIEVTEADSLSLASMLETKALSCAFFTLCRFIQQREP